MVTPAKNLDDVTPQWTWHIEKRKGEFVSLKDNGDVSLADVDVEELPYADVTNTEVAMDTQKNPPLLCDKADLHQCTEPEDRQLQVLRNSGAGTAYCGRTHGAAGHQQQ